eukprot:g13159.t1
MRLHGSTPPEPRTSPGAVREEAVYLVDRMCGSKAGVPVSSRATIKVGEDVMEGSVQAFMMEVQGFIEDYAMPRDLERAHAFVAQERPAPATTWWDGEMLDGWRGGARGDRHPGNLLLLKEEKPHTLGPIDHGCCLPPWWSLSEAIFDAWISWPQLRTLPSEQAIQLLKTAKERFGLD